MVVVIITIHIAALTFLSLSRKLFVLGLMLYQMIRCGDMAMLRAFWARDQCPSVRRNSSTPEPFLFFFYDLLFLSFFLSLCS
jgi:hypothetical protein